MSDLNSIRGTETACPCQILCVTNALADSNLIFFAFLSLLTHVSQTHKHMQHNLNIDLGEI
jgi:hypothetical protein